MKRLIRKILKEEISNPKQEKYYDYIINNIMKDITVTPEKVIYPSIDQALDNSELRVYVENIMDDWREMDRRGWRVSDVDNTSTDFDDDRFLFDKQGYSRKEGYTNPITNISPHKQMPHSWAMEEVTYEVLKELEEKGVMVQLGGFEEFEQFFPDYLIEINTTNNYRYQNFSVPLYYNIITLNYYFTISGKEAIINMLLHRLKYFYGLNDDESKKIVGKLILKIVGELENEYSLKIEKIEPEYYTFDVGRVDESTISDFISFTKDELGLDNDFSVELEDDGDELETLASYDIEDNKVKVLSKNRSLPDIIRSIAHELVHHKQNQEGVLTGDEDEGADGSPQENEANARAGKIVRRFGKRYPEIYDL